jgi:hypothetical protein
MVTKEQAIAAGFGRTEFHYGSFCATDSGPETWRVNGKCKTWKRRPNDWRLPIKWGFRGPFGYVTPGNAGLFHLASECPLLKEQS